jgi:quinol monooxygenase YgiN
LREHYIYSHGFTGEEGDHINVLVVGEIHVKPEDVSRMKSLLAEILPGTRAYDGCQGIDVYSDTEDSSCLVLIEYWDSRAHHGKYIAWRTETGVMEKVGAMLAGPPVMRYYEKIDA